VDATTRGALIGKSIDIVKALLANKASNNYHWLSDRPTPKRSSGKYNVDVVMLLASKVDALARGLIGWVLLLF